MLKIHAAKNKLVPVQRLNLSTQPLRDSYDLLQLASNSPQELFQEIGERLFLAGRNVTLADTGVSADLLAIDEQGGAVVIIIDREEGQPALFRAITCAGIVAGWKPDNFLENLSQQETKSLEEFLAGDLEGLNKSQRVILVAENYSLEALAAAEWLGTRHGIGIAFYRVSVAFDPQAELAFLLSSRVLPKSEPVKPPGVLSIDGTEWEAQSQEGSSDLRVLSERLESETSSRQRAEEALQAMQARYRILAKLSPVGIFHTDASGNFLYVNERWCEIGGVDAEMAMGQGWARAIHPNDRDRVLNEWSESIEKRLPFKSEYRYQRFDGGTSWVLSEAAVQRDEAGNVSGFVGTVTELHRSESPKAKPQPVTAKGSPGPR